MMSCNLVIKHDVTKTHKVTSKSKWLTWMENISRYILFDSNVGCARKRIYHECEVLIYNSVPQVTVWHHLADSGDAKQGPLGQTFLSVPHNYVH